MIPCELQLQNFMCYRGKLPPLVFDGIHIACLSGDNGAGKSAILDAFTWALWGKARINDDELISQGETDMIVELSFQLGDERYRVIRRRQRSGHKSSGKSNLDLHIRRNGPHDVSSPWATISEATIRETQHKINNLLRMTYDTFINASFLLQGRADEFTNKTAGERKQVLADILNLNQFAGLEDRARQRVRVLQGQILSVESAIEHLRYESEKLPIAQEMVTTAQARVDEIRATLEHAVAEQQASHDHLTTLRHQATQLDNVRAMLTRLQQEHHEQQAHAEKLRATMREDDAIIARAPEIAQGIAQLEAANHEYTRLQSLRPHYEELQDKRRQLQEQLKDVRSSLLNESQRLEDEMDRLLHEHDRRFEVAANLANIEQQLAALEPLAIQVRTMQEERSSLDEHLSRVNDLLLEQSSLQARIAQRHDSLVAVREEQKRAIQQLTRQLRDYDTWCADLAHAQSQREVASSLTVELGALRDHERSLVDHISQQRARADRATQQAQDLTQRSALLDPTAPSGTCPLCQSDLSHRVIQTIIEHYEHEIATLRETAESATSDANAQQQTLANLRRDIARQEQALHEAQHHIARIEPLAQQIQQADEWRSQLAAKESALETLIHDLQTEAYEPDARASLQVVVAELQQLEREMYPDTPAPRGLSLKDRLTQQRTQLLRDIRNIEQQLEAQVSLQTQAATHRHDLHRIDEAIAKLPAIEDQVATLRERLDKGDFGHEIRVEGRRVEASLKELGYEPQMAHNARATYDSLLHWRNEQQSLTMAQSRRKSTHTDLQRVEELLQRRTEHIAQHQEQATVLRESLHALPDAEQRARTAEEQVHTCRRDLEGSQSVLHEKKALVLRAQEAEQSLAAKQRERTDLITRQELFDALVKAFGKRGIQARLIETAIPQIEREANRLLGRITGNQMHLTFLMQSETKKGGTIETLDIKIADTVGTRPYVAFSGGEAMRINFAIRVALSRLLAHRAGARLETLVIDEGFGALDADGRERFIDAIANIKDDFRRILVITHLQDLKDRFPAQIEIIKTPRGSEWTLHF